MPTHTITRIHSDGNPNQDIVENVQKIVEGEQDIEVTVPDSTTDMEVTLNIDASGLKTLYMSSDQQLTVETNNGTTPDDTWTLKPGSPLEWDEDSPLANPVSLDVTKVFLTNNSGASATFKARVGQDSTP